MIMCSKMTKKREKAVIILIFTILKFMISTNISQNLQPLIEALSTMHPLMVRIQNLKPVMKNSIHTMTLRNNKNLLR